MKIEQGQIYKQTFPDGHVYTHILDHTRIVTSRTHSVVQYRVVEIDANDHRAVEMWAEDDWFNRSDIHLVTNKSEIDLVKLMLL